MELSKKFLSNLKNRLLQNEAIERYKGRDGVKNLAIDIGDSLELLEAKEAKYVIEKSYQELVHDVYGDQEMDEKSWKLWIVEGMGNVHKSLQQQVMKNTSVSAQKAKNEIYLDR
ncbi:hypothetical protein ACFSCZ_00640 [Siminovitchia sediminis]|uniref:Uncharacterized protein n=1 Tax=Siminovitchia sediminis TaxID=1274353 RepID=A0ABW4KCN2_9BACI